MRSKKQRLCLVKGPDVVSLFSAKKNGGGLGLVIGPDVV